MGSFASRLAQMLDLLVLSAAYLSLHFFPLARQRGIASGDFLQMTLTLRGLVCGAFCLLSWRVILLAAELYTARRRRTFADYLLRWVIGVNACALAAGLANTFLNEPVGSWRFLEQFWALSLLGMSLVRAAILLRIRWRDAHEDWKLLIVGSGPRAGQVVAELEESSTRRYQLLGFVDSQPQEGFVPASMMLGGITDLEQLLVTHRVDEVMIALPMKSQYETVGYTIAVCQMLGIRSSYRTDYEGQDAEEVRRSRHESGRTRSAKSSNGGPHSGFMMMLRQVFFLQDL